MYKPQKIAALTLVFGTLLTLSIFGGTGCTSKADPELILRLDSLDQILKETDELLAVDYIVIENRRKQMAAQENFIRRYVVGTMSKEMGDNMAKYRSIFKVYRRFTNKYDFVNKEHTALLEQSKNLRTDVEKGKISKKDFKLYFRQEMNDASKNLKEAKLIAGNLNTLEPDYQRLRNYMDSWLRSIAKEKPELEQAVQDIENMFNPATSKR